LHFVLFKKIYQCQCVLAVLACSPLTAEELASKRAAILERLAEKKALALTQPAVDRDGSSDRENGEFDQMYGICFVRSPRIIVKLIC